MVPHQPGGATPATVERPVVIGEVRVRPARLGVAKEHQPLAHGATVTPMPRPVKRRDFTRAARTTPAPGS
jgi:hypothetical protein